MRTVVRLAVVVALLLAIGVGGLLAFLPGLIESPSVRSRIEQVARDATGREFHYREISFGLFPPRLVVEEPVLSGETAGAPPFVEARDVSLRMALWPLLTGTVLLESLVIHGATVRLVRDAGGLRLPEPEAEDGSERPAPSAPPSVPAEAEEGGVSLAVQELSLRDSRLILEDRTVTPAAIWDLQDLGGSAALALGAPVALDLDAKLAGGTLRLDGTADLPAETADLSLTLDGVGLATLAPYLPERRELAGALSGTVRAQGALAGPALAADLRLSDGRVRISDVGLSGPLRLRADLSGGERPSGRFDVDATEAALDAYDGAFQKPAGRPGTVKGRFVPKPGGGVTVDDVEIKIHNLDARGRIELDGEGDRLRAELTADPFELAGWDALLPGLADYRLRGTLRPSPLRLATAPLAIHGQVGLEGVRLSLPDGAELALEGRVEGTGDALALHGLELATGGEVLRVAGEVTELSQPRRRYRLDLDADGAEADTLLSAFTAVEDRLRGPLFLDTRLAGRTGDPNLESLTGRMSFAIRPGRLVGVSLLEKTVGQLGTFGEAALLVAALEKPERAKRIERFYGDDFQELAGEFAVAGGWARTEDLRLVYDGYRVDLRGGVRLADRRLDLSGTLTMDPRVDEALADASEGGEASGRPRVIELASVKGTLDSPRVGLSSRTVRSWVGGYAGGKVRGKYQDELDEKLGDELGGEVGDLVEGLFGGRR